MNFAINKIAKGLKLHRQWILASSLTLSSTVLLASQVSERHQYNIEAGSLASALTQFASQTGIYLSSPSGLLAGKTTAGYQGEVSGIEALGFLLQGSNLTFRETETGDLVIMDSQTQEGLILSPLLVEATEENTVGQTSINQDEINTMAGTTGSMTSLLRGNSSVQYSRSSNLSANAASLRPEEISIHGQASYQNAYLIDGVGTNNDLNPGDNEDTFSNPISPTNLSMLGGSSSQAYYIDPDAISSVTVYDSNIPAKFGGFTGGVVDTQLLRYQGEEYTTLKYALSGSDLNSMHVDDETKKDYEEGDSYDGSYTPDYTKRRVSLTSIQELNDSVSGGISVSRSQSDFNQVYTDNAGRGQQKQVEYTDQINNVLGRLDFIASDSLDLGISARYSARNYNGITSTSYDSPFTKTHQAYGITGESIYHSTKGTLTTKLSFDRASDSIDSDSSTYDYHPTSGYLDQSPYSGGYGDIRQQQDTQSVSSIWEHESLSWGETSHNLSTGIEASRIDSFYEVEDDIVSNLYRCISGSASAGCDDSNSDGNHDVNDEYLFTKQIIAGNRFNKSYQKFGAFVEDTINYGNWSATLGLRADYETLLGNTDIAPRSKITWDMFGNESTIFTAGANRYYGRSFLRYAINDTLRSWRTMYRYNSDGELTRTTTYDDRSLSDYDLKTPYSDELSLSVAQRLGDITATLSANARDSKDGVQRTQNDDGQYYYTNTGVSNTKSISLKLATNDGFQIGGTKTTLETSITVTESSSNSQSDNAYDQSVNEDAVYYEGKVVYEDDLPSWDYSIPFKFFFETNTYIPSWNLVWSNNLNLHAGGKVATDSGDNIDIDGVSYDIYENVKFDRYATLDTNFTWTPNIVRDLDGYLQVGINNVFDKVIDVSTNDSNTSYTVGRSVSLEVGMRF